ncbi:MAG: glycerol-3-phosphate acyltransferase, partial [Acutalibacteraceae bacterium]|nr:glycerol-3-phosphate acyltransferase [Acutalibacteraceae bacterium]
GFVDSLSCIFVIDWRVGLIATLIMVVLVLTTKYMSLSTVTALLASPVIMILFDTALPVVEITTLTVIFVAIRHKENFKRLKNGTESKFCLKAR